MIVSSDQRAAIALRPSDGLKQYDMMIVDLEGPRSIQGGGASGAFEVVRSLRRQLKPNSPLSQNRQRA